MICSVLFSNFHKSYLFPLNIFDYFSITLVIHSFLFERPTIIADEVRSSIAIDRKVFIVNFFVQKEMKFHKLSVEEKIILIIIIFSSKNIWAENL